MGVRVSVLLRQAGAVDEGAIRRLDVSDPDLALAVGPYLGVLSREDLGVEVPIEWRGNCLVIRLPADAEDVGEEGDGDGLALKGAVHGDQVQYSGALLGRCALCAVGLLLGRHLAIVLRGNHGGRCL